MTSEMLNQLLNCRKYVTFRVMYDELGHYETFGHAYLVQNGVCARFVDRYHKTKAICGGFRVLSRTNIHEAIEYRSRQVAKIVSWTKNEVWYGSACMQEAFAEGIDYENDYVKVNKYCY
uniref:BMA-PQN-52, isoform a n=1 Tax=Brugia malayi TaxID=6279 RepID=A0A1I9G5S7_BRUMA|nr:BMA-PQN-52, isoform a [Brugia malayi]